MFINGDNSLIDSHKSVSDPLPSSPDVHVIVQTLLERVSHFEKSDTKNAKNIETLQKENKQLSTRLNEYKLKFVTLSGECTRKMTQYDSAFKLIRQDIKQLESVDLTDMSQNLTKITRRN